jgi:GT2 family glycosyltransferase
MTTVVVLGMHRSGTSCVTHALHRAGMHLGSDLMNESSFDNLEGHWEAWEAVRINEAILAASGAAWNHVPPGLSLIAPEGIDSWIASFLGQLNAHSVSGFKDPRTLITFPLWQPHLRGARIVACLRHPYNVAHSLSKRTGEYGCDWQQGLQLWSEYNSRLLSYTENADPETVYWFDFDAEPEAAETTLNELVQQLGLEAEPSRFNPFLRHHATRPAIEEPHLAELYNTLCERAALQGSRLAAGSSANAASLADEKVELRLHQLCEVQTRFHELMQVRQTGTETLLKELKETAAQTDHRWQVQHQQLIERCTSADRRMDAQAESLWQQAESNRQFQETWQRERQSLEGSLAEMAQSIQGLSEQLRQQDAQQALTCQQLQERIDLLQRRSLHHMLRKVAAALRLQKIRHGVARPVRFARRAAGWLMRNRRLPSRAEMRWLLLRLRDAKHDVAHQEAPHPVPAVVVAQIARSEVYDCWLADHSWDDAAAAAAADLLDSLTARPLISLVMPVYNVEDSWLSKAVNSVRAQVYSEWELCIVDDASTRMDLRPLLEELAATDHRIKVAFRSQNGNISAATNDGIRMARGEFVALLDHDDELAPDALLQIARLLNDKPQTDVIYTDQDKIDNLQVRREPFFKPDWSPEYFRSVMYVGHLLAVRRTLLGEVGGCDSRFDGVQDYELSLRLSEKTRRIEHVPQILYHWRTVPGSLAHDANAKQDIDRLQQQAVQEHLDRLNIPAVAVARGGHRVTIRPKPRSMGPRISIMIPSKDQPECLKACLGSLFEKTSYRNFEVIVGDNNTTDPEALKVLDRYPLKRLPLPGPFCFARCNNRMAQHAAGEYLLLLNNDTEVVDADWLEHLLMYAEQQDVGAVGPLLTYPDGTVQHAGVVLGPRGTADHVMRGFVADCDGYAGSLKAARDVSAVTGACLLVGRTRYDACGGLNERFQRHYEDVDFCLRLRRQGLRNVFVGAVRLIHHESKSRGTQYNYTDRVLLLDWWEKDILRGDPYYNPNFDPHRTDYAVRRAA